jgi:sigma-E factor negative regulatory protein RseB
MTRSLGIALALWGGLCLAQGVPQRTPDGMALLRKVYQATEKLSYSGTFVYQQGERNETSRITHLADPGGDVEKVEVLDGAPREIVRTHDTVRYYLPDSQVVKIERRLDQRAFPGVLPEQISDLARNYTVTRGERLRIAGYDCESVVLTPKDGLRYGYILWADAATGMLLKARTLDGKGSMIEQFTFAQLAIGNVSRERVRSRHAVQSWRVEDAAVAPADLSRQGWSVGSELPGFRKVIEVTRRLGEARAVGQVVFSDGMAAVSVFIEPVAGRSDGVRPGLSSLGAFHIYTREVANHIVTVVGEAPADSVQRIANQVEFRRPRQ